jgi:hypothetical protein
MASQGKHIAYFRVSTDRQGKSGLGIEAQRAAVAADLNGGEIVADFTETESGKRSDRPELDKALAAARLHRCPLVVSKVDRLTRSVAFLSRPLVACETRAEAGTKAEAETATARTLADTQARAAKGTARAREAAVEGHAVMARGRATYLRRY